MTIKNLQTTLGWCSIINFVLLFISVAFFMFAHDWVYNIHSKFFNISVETYDALWFLTVAFWKIVVIIFNVVPYFVLRSISKNKGA